MSRPRDRPTQRRPAERRPAELRPAVTDLDATPAEAGHDAVPHRSRWGRSSIVLATAVAALLLAGYGGVGKTRTAIAEERAARIATDGRALHVSVTGATAMAGTGRTPDGQTDVGVVLTLTSTVAVALGDAELDGAPPVVTGPPGQRPARRIEVPVRWRLLCAEVGQLPGPHLLTLHLHTALASYPATVRLSQADAVERVFRLAAADACG